MNDEHYLNPFTVFAHCLLFSQKDSYAALRLFASSVLILY